MKYMVTLNGKKYEIEVEEGQAIVNSVTTAPMAGAPVAAAPAVAPAPVAAPAAPAPAPAPAPAAAPAAPAAPADGTNAVCPMPGTILDVKASVGQAVKAGDVLFILEAMKMENDIVSPADGTVKQILVSKGSTVSTDDVLAVIG
ncbi:MAG: biotin/lipoyl-containing protein [Acutalibacteraceae bacterium]|jgi:biotin carboxyl carrier protein